MLNRYKQIAEDKFKGGFELFRMLNPMFDGMGTPTQYAFRQKEILKVLNFITVDDSDYQDLNDTYKTIASFLSAQGSLEICSQGSVKIRTLIKQVGRNNFDLDCIAVKNCLVLPADPIQFFESIFKPLSYHWPLERKNRCIRFTCPNKKYYLELTPTIRCNDHLSVVDREEEKWKASNPIKYAEWFDLCAEDCAHPATREISLDSAKVEPLPSHRIGFDDILRSAVRLFKRHRDRYYFHASDLRKTDKPISCIITTLTAQAMVGLLHERSKNNLDLNGIELLVNCLKLMPSYILGEPGNYSVVNPVEPAENFAEKWNSNPSRKEEFDKWRIAAIKDFSKIANETDPRKLKELCNAIFGEYEEKDAPSHSIVLDSSSRGLA